MPGLMRLFAEPEEAIQIAYNRGKRDYRLSIHFCHYQNSIELKEAWQKGYDEAKEEALGQIRDARTRGE